MQVISTEKKFKDTQFLVDLGFMTKFGQFKNGRTSA